MSDERPEPEVFRMDLDSIQSGHGECSCCSSSPTTLDSCLNPFMIVSISPSFSFSFFVFPPSLISYVFLGHQQWQNAVHTPCNSKFYWRTSVQIPALRLKNISTFQTIPKRILFSKLLAKCKRRRGHNFSRSCNNYSLIIYLPCYVM
jgi:hypothetical protein